ncbi:hypothetical protein NIES2119_00250 [[Phormidium ambiguum] IAM M-71]|uniref:Peptidase metallopeptidase domain-containing protein n=1 Tax=[Phormidium ambiguum] IAM M-71 TaxID=454136 RepID=A0A1U7ITH5_9CYAN|nr:M10 family metallopeptidase [Phormidium ambiguum]OKH40784.1 hypothetical protein NIES2119_00250 [Phormidium ambiguum IAM M-71]
MADTRLRLEDIFDPNYYRQQNPDLGNISDQQALQHFRIYGLQEGRQFSQFFDLAFFEASNPDLASGLNVIALQNFFDTGLPQARQFSPNFDLNYYRASNPDLGNLDNNQLFKHFLNFGLNEGRNFNPLIDLNYYRASNPDLAGLSNRDLFTHFINIGITENRPFLPLFDFNFYLENNRDLSDDDSFLRDAESQDGESITYREVINHWLSSGLNERRRFSPYVDLDYYLSNNQDLVVAGLNGRQAYDHFRNIGVNEGRRFSRFFDTNYYLANNHDLRAAGLTPGQAFNHFVNFGVREGRRGSVLFDPAYYLANNPDIAAAGTSFEDAFKDFQTFGFSQARSSSLWFDPEGIAALLNVRQGPEEQIIQDWLANADKWLDIPIGGTLTYSFVTTASAPLYEGGETGVREVTPEIKNNVRNIMRNLSQYIPINFVEVPDRPPNVGRIRVMFSNGPAGESRDGDVYAYAYFPSDFPGSGLAGDIHLNPDRSLVDFSAGPGSFGYQVLLHEIGHALGLKHPFESLYQLPPGRDNNTNTVMTYNLFPGFYDGSYPITPMAFDIRALQYLYGATYYNQGDTTYNFDYNNFIGPNQNDGRNGFKQTIWDAGGVDTLNFSALPPIPGGYYFNMNEGGQNTTQFALNGSVYSIPNPGSTDTEPLPRIPLLTDSFGTSIGFGVQIENLFGSQGDDEILGNNLSNFIVGGPGNDNITGAGGLDLLAGGDGSDIFTFASGDGSRNPATTDVIADFQPGIDKIGLSLGLPSSLIAITQGTGANAADTFIWVPSSGEYLAILKNIPAFLVGFNDLIPV